jgi:hypothetical protein
MPISGSVWASSVRCSAYESQNRRAADRVPFKVRGQWCRPTTTRGTISAALDNISEGTGL